MPNDGCRYSSAHIPMGFTALTHSLSLPPICPDLDPPGIKPDTSDFELKADELTTELLSLQSCYSVFSVLRTVRPTDGDRLINWFDGS